MVSGRHSYLLGILLILLSSVPAAFAQSVPSGTWGPYGVVIERNIMVPMRDGVKLATDVYLPARNGVVVPGKFPVLLQRTPYDKIPQPIVPGQFTPQQVERQHMAYYFASYGYAVVLQDCRGQFASQGTFYLDTNEGPDGYDTLEWAARQPWSNGKVATYGASYLSQVQSALAALRPPHLVAMFIMVGASNYYKEGAYRGGEFYLLHNLVYAMHFALTSHDSEANPAVRPKITNDLLKQNLTSWLLAYPYRPGASPLRITPTNERWFQDLVDHSTFDAYWHKNGYDFEDKYNNYPDIPIYFISGWYDLFERGSLHNYMGMAARHKSLTKLLMGPWVHNVGHRSSGDVDFGPAARVDMVAQAKLWFDDILKGDHDGIMSGPKVRIFIMGGGSGLRNAEGKMEDGGQWFNTTAWPPPQSSSHPFYLHANGTLNEQAPAEEAPSSFRYDPRHPVPTIGGQIDSGKEFSPAGPQDQKCSLQISFCQNDLPLSSRRDVLVFETPPLKSDVVIAGPVTVDLWISSSAPDTDFTAKLIDQFPPNKDYPWGYAMNLEDRIIRVSSSPDPSEHNLLKPGEVRKVTIDLLGVANRFAKGHRIRLDISSSNFPFFAVNPNTGERPGYQTHIVVARNTVYHDREHPSHVNLPLLPVSALGGR
jgi:putative CocE/NonD family hydrolase